MIPDSVTSIGERAFVNCTSLTAIEVATLNPAYSSLDGVLFDMSQTVLVLCPAVRAGAYSVPTSVTSIGNYAFSHCTGLTSITIPDSVTSIGGSAFGGCTGLTSITIPNSVTAIGWWAFSGCTGLTSMTLPESITTIEMGTFRGCTSLTSVMIPDSVTSIGEWAFSYCTGLTSVMIPDSVTSIGGLAFDLCTGLTSVYFRGNAPSIGEDVFGEDWFDLCPRPTLYYQPGTTGWGATFADRPTALWISLTLGDAPLTTDPLPLHPSWPTGATLRVQRSTNLLDWEDWMTVNRDEGPGELHDADAGTVPYMFYRVLGSPEIPMWCIETSRRWGGYHSAEPATNAGWVAWRRVVCDTRTGRQWEVDSPLIEWSRGDYVYPVAIRENWVAYWTEKDSADPFLVLHELGSSTFTTVAQSKDLRPDSVVFAGERLYWLGPQGELASYDLTSGHGETTDIRGGSHLLVLGPDLLVDTAEGRWTVVDAESGELRDVRFDQIDLSVFYPGISSVCTSLAFYRWISSNTTGIGVEVDESIEGIDLNQDGDVLDSVLHIYQDGAIENLGFVGDFASISGRWLAFVVLEQEQDLNGDGDIADAVAFVYDLETHQSHNLQIAVDSSHSLAGNRAFVREAGTLDLHIFDLRGSVPENVLTLAVDQLYKDSRYPTSSGLLLPHRRTDGSLYWLYTDMERGTTVDLGEARLIRAVPWSDWVLLEGEHGLDECRLSDLHTGVSEDLGRIYCLTGACDEDCSMGGRWFFGEVCAFGRGCPPDREVAPICFFNLVAPAGDGQ